MVEVASESTSCFTSAGGSVAFRHGGEHWAGGRPSRGGPARRVVLSVWIAVCLVPGCSRESPSLGDGSLPEAAAANAAPTREAVEHDVGEVVAGESLTHAFSFQNPLGEPVFVAGDADIRKECGCTRVELAARTLQPGAKTDVTLSVDTAGREGAVNYGATISWRTAGGRESPSTFRLKGRVLPAIRIDPSSLVFSQKEVVEGVTKELAFRSGFPIDWRTLRVSSSSPHAQLTPVEIGKDGGRCSVRFAIPGDVGNVTASITANARMRSDSPRLGGSEVLASVRAIGEHAVELGWKPESVRIWFDGKDKTGRGQLILWGERLAKDRISIESISCEGYEVGFTVSRLAGDSAMVDLRFSQSSSPGNRPDPSTIVLRMQGQDFVRIPVFVDGVGGVR